MNVPSIFLSGTLLLAGIGIPIMAALNSGLGARLGNPTQAAAWLFALALFCSLLVLWLQQQPLRLTTANIPAPYFLGGLFVAFYVLAITFIAPKIGVGNAVALVLLGQLAASTTIDHFGWMGAPQTTLNASRAAGVICMMIGVVLTRRLT
ncbi:MAG: DMT family transporter [Pseudomonadota bacterium]